MHRIPLLLGMLTVVAGLAWQGAGQGAGQGASQGERQGEVAYEPARGQPPARVPGGVGPGGRAGGPAASAAHEPPPWPPAPPSPRAGRLLALDDLQTFPALPAPGPSDWLAQHEEQGQSLEDFLARARRDVTETRHTLRLQPLDDVATLGVDLSVLAEHLRAYYGLPVTTASPARPQGLTSRVNEQTGRRQVLAPDIMRWLEGEITRDLVCVLAVTTEDLYPEPSWNFVFGMASLHRGVGVFSFARMDPTFPLPPPEPATRPAAESARILRRCLKVVTHEVGHMFALEHCIERSCLMNGSNHAGEMDRTPLHLCPACLRKVQHATRLDAAVRYETLRAFYRRHGLEAEAAWVDALLERVPP